MKKNISKKTITLASLAALSSFSVALLPINAMAKNPKQAVIADGQFSVQDQPWERAAVAEMIGLCNDRTSLIEHALNQANMTARHNLNQAASIIANAIIQSAAVPQFNVGQKHFHFIIALKGAAGVADAIMRSTAAAGTLGPNLTGQIRYGLLAELAELVLEAHEELDVKFMYSMYQRCGYGCGHSHDLPQDYYNGVARLAGNFLDLMTSTKEGTAERDMLGSIKVELPLTKAVAHAAKIVLINSRLRESYASRIHQLQNLEIMIQDMLVPGGVASEDPQDARSEVRSAFDCIKIYPYVW